MLSPATSPSMVGRSRELQALRAAQRATLAGEPRGAVVAGEAGIGKSRLLDELLADLGDAVVARGQCVALGALAAPLAPIRDVLRELLDAFGEERLRAAAAPIDRLLPATLPELARDEQEALSQGQLHDAVRLLLERLSAEAPLAVVVEDVHWSDVPTLDVLRSLLRTLRRGRVLVVLSHRTDLPRDHPLQPFLLELERARDTIRIELAPLTRSEAAEQARRILGDGAAPAAIDAVVERSDGVPFFVEELLGLDRADGALPETLRELLLSRYARLDERAQAVVRLVAAGGARVDHDVVERVHAGDPAELEAGLRAAVAAHVLQADATGYRFRHALTHEAVRDELLPGERRRVHARYADALEGLGREAGGAAEVARHRLAAGDAPRALSALVAASRDARAGGAPVAAAQLADRALELWDEVADAAERAGCERSRLVLEAARGYGEASDPRALPTLERGLATVPPDDRLGRALLLHEAMVVRYGDGLPGGLGLAREALALVADESDEEGRAVRVRALTGLGVIEALEREPGARGRLERAAAEARALMDDASDPEVAARARFELVRALTNLGRARAVAGDVDAALAGLDDALALSQGDPLARLRHAEHAGWLLHHLGRHEEAIRLADACVEAAAAAGMEGGFGAEIALLGAQSRLARGELDAAAAVAARVRSVPLPRTSSAYCAAVEGELLLLHDDAAGAAERLASAARTIADMRATDANDDMQHGRIAALVALAHDDLPGAWAQTERLWAWPGPEPGPTFPLVGLGAHVLARLRRAGAEPPGMASADAEARLRETLAHLAVWDVADDWRAVLEAELGGPAGDGADVDAWREAVDATARGRLPLRLHVHTLYRLAGELLALGDRAAATGVVERATGIAAPAGMHHATRVLDELARRSGLRLPRRRAASAPGGATALTPREQQVLALVAEGLTNRQIGDRLFISVKTASVHVSAILHKLGAATRAEAAARAAALLGGEAAGGA